MTDISTDALAEAHYASRDPQYRDEEDTIRQLHEEVEGAYDETYSIMQDIQWLAKEYGLHQNKLVREALSGFDQALDALDILKGELQSEISDF